MIGTYDSDADQVEALKRLWKEYGVPAIVGLIIGIVVLYGYRFYQGYRVKQDKAAAAQYQLVWDATASHADYMTPLNALRKDHPHSVYAILGSLMVAHEATVDKKLDVAKEQLQWALDHGDKNIVQDIVRARLARVLIESGKPAEAIKVLDALNAKTYASIRDQIKGDAYVKLNQFSEARKAYENALLQNALPDENRRVLQMKLADIATGGVS